VAALAMILPAMVMAVPARAETVPDSWTVMIYMAGDNTLSSATVTDMSELMVVGSSADVNFVVMLDTADGPASLLYVNQGSTTVLADWGEVNTGDPAVLTRLITDAKTLYPANRYALDLWDHGNGIMGICYDDTSGDKITMAEMRSAVVSGGVVFESVIFDACVMGSVEVAHQLQGYANTCVFSQDFVYGAGFPYDQVAAGLVANPAMDGKTFSVMSATVFMEYYAALGWNGVAITAYDNAYLTTVSSAVQSFASAQIATMAQYYKVYKACRLSTVEINCAADLAGYAKLVAASTKITSTTVKNAANAVVAAVDSAVMYEWHTTDNAGLTGAGIWFPVNSLSYYWSATMETMYRGMLFDQATGWANFLDSYYAKA